MSTRMSVLDQLRTHRSIGVWTFVALLLVVAAERRLSELHFNLRSAAPGLESADSLDGDEIRVRLVVANDEKSPALPPTGPAAELNALRGRTESATSRALGRPAPRGPPASRSSLV